MKLVGNSSDRRLQSTIESTDGDEENIESAYGFEVTLQKEQTMVEEVTSSNSANTLAAMGVATFDIILTLPQVL
eukprot:CAMPEP_0172568274 /NCGR_PEP_ID=MMETSP1067-20121228/119251_1 /TAXON_ID=265564 ORGANISM="Thalassiosira punctigera, Strain Tpunct2005C2" /NCGR_SAMPLE_ID=MMETSP1067 /ASSEMBLY_ACC=CAM_ASM_000444 /LENGTH=73 /DNA_ID=CAMNT_0013359837 /DNA_START=683 /DNA_END=904 /DNA_ORIENTATION=+